MALVDANYKFICVDVGSEGRHSDGGVFKKSLMGKRFLNNEMNVPLPCNAPNGPVLPFVILGDEAFELSSFLMRPYTRATLNHEKFKKWKIARKIYNYRLSRARRTVENAFGLLAMKWRIFRRPINLSMKNTEMIVLASICLHNFLIDEGVTKKPTGYQSIDLFKLPKKRAFIALSKHNDSSCTASNSRDICCKYFLGEGSIPFQLENCLK